MTVHICMLVLAFTNCLYEENQIAYHTFFTHLLSGRVFDLRPRSLCFDTYCLFVCVFVCLFVFIIGVILYKYYIP